VRRPQLDPIVALMVTGVIPTAKKNDASTPRTRGRLAAW
jgi:hypothetical protein